jgi:hypothetical protein
LFAILLKKFDPNVLLAALKLLPNPIIFRNNPRQSGNFEPKNPKESCFWIPTKPKEKKCMKAV